MKFQPGLYDALLTRQLREELLQAELLDFETEEIEPKTAALYVARLVAAAGASRVGDRKKAEELIELANRLLEDGLEAPLEVLKAIYRGVKPQRPVLPLGENGLIVNARDDARLGPELERGDGDGG